MNLDQDIIEVARSLSRARDISLGAALSILVRRGMRSSFADSGDSPDGPERFPTFEVTESAPSFGTEEVRRALDEE